MMRPKYLSLLLLLVSLFLCSCGSEGDSNSDILENGLLGAKKGTVTLTRNGCSEYRDIPVREIDFQHDISATVTSTGRLNLTFQENGYVCNGLDFDRFGGRFDVNCGIQPLVNFLPNYRCTQELVWSYSGPSDSGSLSSAEVKRTAFVRCSQGDVLQLACPVEYEGHAMEG